METRPFLAPCRDWTPGPPPFFIPQQIFISTTPPLRSFFPRNHPALQQGNFRLDIPPGPPLQRLSIRRGRVDPCLLQKRGQDLGPLADVHGPRHVDVLLPNVVRVNEVPLPGDAEDAHVHVEKEGLVGVVRGGGCVALGRQDVGVDLGDVCLWLFLGGVVG